MTRTLLMIIFLLGSLQGFAQKAILQVADSLFKHGRQSEASLMYEAYIRQTDNKNLISLPIYYKLAYLSEKRNDFAKTLYYLSLIYDREPKKAVMNKINDIANIHNLQGFELDDFSFVFLFFRNYYLYVILFLLTIAVYAFLVVVQKQRKAEIVRTRHKWVIVLYLVALLMLLNLPSTYQIAIVNKSPTYMREMPSSAAPAKWAIGEGNKVVIIGETDEWWQVWWEKKALYIRKLDVWKIG